MAGFDIAMNVRIFAILASISLTALSARAQLLIFDDYNVTGSGTGFALGSGVNSGIISSRRRKLLG